MEKLNMKEFMNNLISMYVKGEQKMTEKEQKKSYICYVYGQVYAGYLKSNKDEYYMVKNTKAQNWKAMLNWFKDHDCIEDFKLGDTPETAGEVIVKGFNENKILYDKYCKAIEENLKKELQEAA